jgi:hypothetical protein
MRRLIAFAMPLLFLAGSSSLALAAPAHHSIRNSVSARGKIEFGYGLERNKIVHPTTKIAKNKYVAWMAHFSKKAGTTKVTVKLIQISGPGAHPKTPWTAKFSVSKSAMTAGSYLSPKQLNSKHITLGAKFELEYLAGSHVLSTGKFTRLSCANCGGTGGGY